MGVAEPKAMVLTNYPSREEQGSCWRSVGGLASATIN